VEAPDGLPPGASERCGAWNAELYRTDPPASFAQATCVARLVAGVGEGTSSALSRLSWREAAEGLGLGAAGGPATPPGNPTVWLARLGGAPHEPPGSGRVVVLDTATGRPYVLVTLGLEPYGR